MLKNKKQTIANGRSPVLEGVVREMNRWTVEGFFTVEGLFGPSGEDCYGATGTASWFAFAGGGVLLPECRILPTQVAFLQRRPSGTGSTGTCD